MLALDMSESVDGAPLEDLKQAALAVVRLLRPDDRAALITFNDYVTLRAGWTARDSAARNGHPPHRSRRNHGAL